MTPDRRREVLDVPRSSIGEVHARNLTQCREQRPDMRWLDDLLDECEAVLSKMDVIDQAGLQRPGAGAVTKLRRPPASGGGRRETRRGVRSRCASAGAA
jgi:hypothetical protein